MKLFLHWIRWDLRRFRVMLLLWSALLLVYGAFLSYLHLNIVKVDPDLFDLSKPWALLLFMVQCFMVGYLFSSDPAVGSEWFWKTRPPTGFVVAGSKLVVAAVFFLVLPIGLWLLVKGLAGPDFVGEARWSLEGGLHDYNKDAGLPWTWLLLAMQGLTVGLLGLFSTSLRHPWHLLIRMGLALLLILLPELTALLLAGWRPWSMGSLLQGKLGIIMSPWFCLLLPALGASIYLLCRVGRTPVRLWRFLSVVIPAAVVLTAVVSPVPVPSFPLPLDDLEPLQREGVAVQGYVSPLGEPQREMTDSYFMAYSSWDHYQISLKVKGLADEAAAGVWKNFRVISSEGEVLEAKVEPLSLYRFNEQTKPPGVVRVMGASFNMIDAARFAFRPFRAEGLVRIYLFGQATSEINLSAGEMWRTSQGSFYYPHEFTDQGLSNRLVWSLDPAKPGNALQLTHRQSGESWPASLVSLGARTGFLMLAHQEAGYIDLEDNEKTWSSARRRAQMMEALDLREWTLHQTWKEPLGFIDVPVVLDPFVLPGLNIRPEIFADRLKALTWPEDAAVEEKRKALWSFATIANMGGSRDRLSALCTEAGVSFLEQITDTDLPLLLEWTKERTGGYGGRLLLDEPVRQRIAALATPAEAASWQADPDLFKFLQPALIQSGKIPTPEPGLPPVSWNAAALTDEALAAWDQEKVDSSKPPEMIAEAMRRGLPWSMAAAVELMRSNIRQYRVKELLALEQTAREVIENPWRGPADSYKLWAWLKSHYQNLVFDPVRRKWVLPEAAPPNPAPIPAPGQAN
jgi:hypothetical protein